jgi:predicted RNA-binding protein with RPS1 domain
MVSGIPPVGITQIERFLSYDTVLLGVRYVESVNNLQGLVHVSDIAPHCVKSLKLQVQT